MKKRNGFIGLALALVMMMAFATGASAHGVNVSWAGKNTVRVGSAVGANETVKVTIHKMNTLGNWSLERSFTDGTLSGTEILQTTYTVKDSNGYYRIGIYDDGHWAYGYIQM